MSPPPESLEERLDAEFARAWRPEPGEKLVGEIVALSEGTSSYDGRRYPIVTVRTQEGELAVHAFHTVLLDELAKAKPVVGEVIGIKYDGEVNDGKSRYRRYRVVIDRPEGGVDWSGYAEAEELPPSPRSPPDDAPARVDGQMPELNGPLSQRAPGPDDEIPF